MLTLKKLQAMKPHHIFEFKVGDNGDRTFMFVAKKGGIDDWVIYTSLNAVPMVDFWAGDKKGVALNGEKLVDKELIRKLIPCDDEVFKMYRH